MSRCFFPCYIAGLCFIQHWHDSILSVFSFEAVELFFRFFLKLFCKVENYTEEEETICTYLEMQNQESKALELAEETIGFVEQELDTLKANKKKKKKKNGRSMLKRATDDLDVQGCLIDSLTDSFGGKP